MSDAIVSFQPENIPQAMELSKTLSVSNLLPVALRGKPADVLIILMTGRELGLQVMQSLRGLNVIEGRVAMSADMMVALAVRKRDVCEFFRMIESTDKRATYEAKRVGSEPVKISFTIEEAQRAGLTGKNNWKNYPPAMLRARAASALARVVFPDMFLGIYDPDEIDTPFEKNAEAPVSINTPSRTEEILGKLKEKKAESVDAEFKPNQPPAHDAPPNNPPPIPQEGPPPAAKKPARVPGTYKGKTIVTLEASELSGAIKELTATIDAKPLAPSATLARAVLDELQIEQTARINRAVNSAPPVAAREPGSDDDAPF